MSARLSEHFSLAEFAVSAAHPELVRPVPPQYQTQLRALVTHALEPARVGLGVPLAVLSGYRSPALNKAAGGSATSQHVVGEAADLAPQGRPALALFDWFRAQVAAEAPGLELGQVIFYPAQHFVHVARPSDRYPRATFCVHLPAKGILYRVVSPTTSVAHLVTAAR